MSAGQQRKDICSGLLPYQHLELKYFELRKIPQKILEVFKVTKLSKRNSSFSMNSTHSQFRTKIFGSFWHFKWQSRHSNNVLFVLVRHWQLMFKWQRENKNIRCLCWKISVSTLKFVNKFTNFDWKKNDLLKIFIPWSNIRMYWVKNVSRSNPILGKILRRSIWIPVSVSKAIRNYWNWMRIWFLSRHVILPNDLARQVPKSHLMTETEWRNLGVQQSPGWVHYMLHAPEPHVLLFRRPLPQPSESSAAVAATTTSPSLPNAVATSSS